MSILQKNQSSQQTRAKQHLQNLQLSRVNGSLFTSSKSRDKTPNASGPVNINGDRDEGLFNSFAERKHAIHPDCEDKPMRVQNDLRSQLEQKASLRMIQEQLFQYQIIIKDQRSELDKQRKMNEKLKKTLQNLVQDQKKQGGTSVGINSNR